MKSYPELENDKHILWDYMHLNEVIHPADAIVVLGSHDSTAALRAADLFHQGYAPLIICSGGLGKGTLGSFEISEAATYKKILREQHVPESVIYLEEASCHSGENFLFTKKLIEEHHLAVKDIIFVHKPYMERRVRACAARQWPELHFQVTSLPLSYEAYMAQARSEDEEIHILVGDIQRMRVFVDWGFQVEDEVPAHVWTAYERLVQAGYTQYLLGDSPTPPK